MAHVSPDTGTCPRLPPGSLQPSVQLWPALGDALSHLPDTLESVRLWREKILYPWKFNRIKHNDVELQRQVWARGLVWVTSRKEGTAHFCSPAVAAPFLVEHVCPAVLGQEPYARHAHVPLREGSLSAATYTASMGYGVTCTGVFMPL